MDETKSEASPSGPEIASPPHTNLAGSTYHEEVVMSDAMNPSLQAVRFDAIELAGFPFLDELNAPLVAARPNRAVCSRSHPRSKRRLPKMTHLCGSSARSSRPRRSDDGRSTP